MNKTETLQISYEDFFAVLKEWENYTRVELNQMPKRYKDAFSQLPWNIEIDDVFATEQKLSDLAHLLWQSLKAGANRVEEIHSNAFVDEQAEFFKKLFSDFNINKCFNDLEEPKEHFFMLGEPAQIKLIHEGIFGQVISRYEKIKPIKERESFNEECRRKKLGEEKRKKLPVNKEVQELDRMECVFCGEIGSKCSRYFQQPETEYVPENVFLSCRACIKKNLEPKFGRFLVNK